MKCIHIGSPQANLSERGTFQIDASQQERSRNARSEIAMKENILYWIRVLILSAILLFILVSCTVWAHPAPNASSDFLSVQAKNIQLERIKAQRWR